MTDGPATKAPSPAEAMFFYAIVKHTKNKADINWEGVANEQGLKNAEVAKVRFGQIRRKLGINTESSPRKPTATSGTAKKTKATTSGVRKTKAAKGAKSKAEVSDSNDEGSGKSEEHDSAYARPVKKEKAEVEAQLHADMAAMINEDPF